MSYAYYYCNNYLEIGIIKSEVEQCHFVYRELKIYYYHIGLVDKYYQVFHMFYKHNYLGTIERYKNIYSKYEIQNLSP